MDRKNRKVRLSSERIETLVRFVARREKRGPADVEVVVVNRREITQLNREYLSHAGATDVISFDLTDDHNPQPNWLIVVCDEVATTEAKKRNLPAPTELMLYIIHGLLHQMGYDDQSPKKAAIMHARQAELLAEFLKK